METTKDRSFSYDYERCQCKNFIIAKEAKLQHSVLRLKYDFAFTS